MAVYVVGDVQGCFEPLQKLLEKIQFDSQYDQLWFTGDLVNRGKQSLATLRFVKSLKNAAKTVLGNHDLHLLAVAAGARAMHPKDTLQEILAASDCEELLTWLRQQPLLHEDSKYNVLLAHAGIYPLWSLTDAKAKAQLVENKLKSANHRELLMKMYGDEPQQLTLQGDEFSRLRFIINAFTRMRFCAVDGALDLSYKGELGKQPNHLYPWFAHPKRIPIARDIMFGHWAALYSAWPALKIKNIIPLDSGCVWGNVLTAIRLEDRALFQVKCTCV